MLFRSHRALYNDGCAVARSNEAKALGIKMGDPLFKIRDIVEKNGVAVFSGNFALYGDMSRRVQEVLRCYSPSIEVYSIDEAFLDLDGMDVDFDKYAKDAHVSAVVLDEPMGRDIIKMLGGGHLGGRQCGRKVLLQHLDSDRKSVV